jgi:hypothetical protein
MGDELGKFLRVALERLDLSSSPHQMARRGRFMAQKCNSDRQESRHGYSGTYACRITPNITPTTGAEAIPTLKILRFDHVLIVLQRTCLSRHPSNGGDLASITAVI